MKKTLRLLTILLLFILSLVITAYPAFGQLKEGNLIWTTTEENILYILRSNETEPSVFLDILKTGSSLLFMLNQQTRCQDNILLTQKFRKFLKP